MTFKRSRKASERALSDPLAPLPEYRGGPGGGEWKISFLRGMSAFGTQPQLRVRGFRLACQMKILARVLTVAISGIIILLEWPFIIKHLTIDREEWVSLSLHPRGSLSWSPFSRGGCLAL